MNVLYDGRAIVHFCIEEISCYYFCSHFHKIFKIRKKSETQMSFSKDTKKNEMIIYCHSCRDFLRGLFYYLRPLSERYFNGVEKILVQHITVIK